MIPGSWVPGHRVGDRHEDRSGSDNSLSEKDSISKKEPTGTQREVSKPNYNVVQRMALDICFNRLSRVCCICNIVLIKLHASHASFLS